MRAVVQDRYGGPDVLSVGEVPRPQEIDSNQVLVQVVAAGVDRGALHLITGQPYLMRIGGVGFRAPKRRVPGVSFAGRIVAVGSGVTGFTVSQEVYGAARGAYAEFVLARADQTAAKPTRLSFDEAAVLPYAAFPSYQGLRDYGHVQPGQQVLVIGASGAVGSIAVQLAKAFGAEVTGVCGPRDRDLTKSLGADHTIDYTAVDFADGTHHYDLILDVFGRTPLRRLRRALTPTGTLVIVGGEGGRWIGGLQRQIGAALLSPFVRQTLKFFVAKETNTTLQEINQLVESGKLRPVVAGAYPLGQASDAFTQLSTGSVSGRLVLRPER